MSDTQKRRIKNKGMVYLIGAGPGRPDLLTLRGARCLEKADAVVIDALVSRRVLSHCRPDVQIHDAGKRGHGKVSMKQDHINHLLVRLAGHGKIVVRLKGGDPYFFGRGGEEAEYLQSQKVPFEVVPGVSSVVAVPSYSGIPVTHRGHTSTVTVVTGHPSKENKYLRESRQEFLRRKAPDVDWEKLDSRNTLIILMGVGQISEIVKKLLSVGWSRVTPVCVTQWGTFPYQKSVAGTIENIEKKIRQFKIGAPATIVLGSVVRLRSKLNWYEQRPLYGKTILVTRAQRQSPGLADFLESEGACVNENPTIEIRPISLSKEKKRYLGNLAQYDYVLFTSINAAQIFIEYWKKTKKHSTWPKGLSVGAIGAKTAEVIIKGGLPLHGVAREAIAESLLDWVGSPRGKKILIPRALEGRDILMQGLKKKGARVDVWPLYKTVPHPLSQESRNFLLAGQVDFVTFTSSSTVHSFMKSFRKNQIKKIFKKTKAASIGPVTSQTLRFYGVRPSVEPDVASVEELGRSICEKVVKGKK